MQLVADSAPTSKVYVPFGHSLHPSITDSRIRVSVGVSSITSVCIAGVKCLAVANQLCHT